MQDRVFIRIVAANFLPEVRRRLSGATHKAMGFLGLGSLNGVGMIVLQILRVFTLIALGTVITSTWVLIIKIDKERTYWFFDATSLFFTSTIAVFLAISELPFISFLRNYFNRTWPVLSEEHGLSWLGAAMVVIGCNVLGKLNQPANDAKEIGLPWWRLVLASGVLVITFGFFNIASSLIWRDGKNGITARAIRAKGSLASIDGGSSLPSMNDTFYSKKSHQGSLRDEKTRSKFVSMFWRRGQEEADAPATRPQIHISHPISSQQDVERDAGDQTRSSPIMPGMQRPPTALHPMHTGRSSTYSAAHISQF